MQISLLYLTKSRDENVSYFCPKKTSLGRNRVQLMKIIATIMTRAFSDDLGTVQQTTCVLFSVRKDMKDQT